MRCASGTPSTVFHLPRLATRNGLSIGRFPTCAATMSKHEGWRSRWDERWDWLWMYLP